LSKILDGLEVHPERLQHNLHLTRGLLASENVLLALTGAGWAREKAYAHVQKAALRVQQEEIDFRDALLQDSEVRDALGPERLTELLHVEPRYDMADEILRRLDILQ